MVVNKYKVKKVFNDYVKNYDSSNDKIKLKIDHTYRVSELCAQIASSLGFNNKEIDIAYLIGLLHDIGRFEQVKKYGTFNDSKSIDHAKLGVKILFEEGKIREFIKDDSEDELIRNTIEYHNSYEIPVHLSKRTLAFCNILRDADKIDIFKVNAIVPLEKIYDAPSEDIFSSVVTEEVMENLKNRQTVLKKLKKTAVDNVASHISLVFGIEYNESIIITMEQGYLKKLMNFKSENNITRNQFDEIKKMVNSYIEERLKNS